MGWFVPLASAAIDAAHTTQAGLEDATLLRNQAATASAQGYADEAAQRRAAKSFLAKQAAAAAEAGGGYGGTMAGVLSDSYTAAEIDALNIRYRSTMRSKGLLYQADEAVRGSQRKADGELLRAAATVASTALSSK